MRVEPASVWGPHFPGTWEGSLARGTLPWGKREASLVPALGQLCFTRQSWPSDWHPLSPQSQGPGFQVWEGKCPQGLPENFSSDALAYTLHVASYVAVAEASVTGQKLALGQHW